MPRLTQLLQVIAILHLAPESSSADCNSDKLSTSIDQIKDFKTGGNLPSKFTDGDTYTVVCKYPGTQVFTNDVRRQPSVDQAKIDEFDSTTSSQLGQITVSCTSGNFVPDIFSLVTSWCAVGCSPLPEDDNQYWRASYPDESLSTELSKAPVQSSTDAYIHVKCRAGYAPEMYQLGGFYTRCLSSGYSPGLSSLVQCTAGCSDIAAEVSNAKVVSERSAVKGAPPYNIGSVASIQCSTGYSLKGAEHVTCSSLQLWRPPAPVCVANSSPKGTCLTALLTLAITFINPFF